MWKGEAIGWCLSERVVRQSLFLKYPQKHEG